MDAAAGAVRAARGHELITAIKARDVDTVRTLLQQGASANTKMGLGAGVTVQLGERTKIAIVSSALQLAAALPLPSGDAAAAAATASQVEIIHLLASHGAAVDDHASMFIGEHSIERSIADRMFGGCNLTALHIAVMQNSVACVRALLKEGASTEVASLLKITPLASACMLALSPDIVIALVEAGADVNHRFLVADGNFQRLPILYHTLTCASLGGELDAPARRALIIQYLVSKGATH